MMQSNTSPSPPKFPLPGDDSPTTGWYFDRAFEALVFIELKDGHGPQMNVNAWSRHVWESVNCTLNALRTMPAAPRAIHDALAPRA